MRSHRPAHTRRYLRLPGCALARTCAAAALVAACAVSPPAPAFERVVVFGDSNVDNGNLYRLTGGKFPGPPRWQGRESDGPVVVEYLARNLNARLEDRAVSGATTGEANISARFAPWLRRIASTGLSRQIDDFLAQGGRLGDEDLIVLWAGSNDLLGLAAGDREALDARISGAVLNLEKAVERLHADGGRHLVIATRTPRQALGSPNDRNGLELNRAIGLLGARLQVRFGPGVMLYDAYAAVADMMKNPGHYGFSETDALCIDVPACAAQSVDTGMTIADRYTNWDGAHKTTHVHRLMAEQIQGLLSR
jgi:phospholipase/lecithinase/hemolysin